MNDTNDTKSSLLDWEPQTYPKLLIVSDPSQTRITSVHALHDFDLKRSEKPYENAEDMYAHYRRSHGVHRLFRPTLSSQTYSRLRALYRPYRRYFMDICYGYIGTQSPDIEKSFHSVIGKQCSQSELHRQHRQQRQRNVRRIQVYVEHIDLRRPTFRTFWWWQSSEIVQQFHKSNSALTEHWLYSWIALHVLCCATGEQWCALQRKVSQRAITNVDPHSLILLLSHGWNLFVSQRRIISCDVCLRFLSPSTPSIPSIHLWPVREPLIECASTESLML